VKGAFVLSPDAAVSGTDFRCRALFALVAAYAA
jgi:hypothetical protein